MNYGKKPISEMTDDELTKAKESLDNMIVDLETKRKNPDFVKKFKNRPAPTINPAFVELQNAINNEITTRKEKQNG